MKAYRFFFACAVFLGLSACGPKITISPNFDQNEGNRIALLPVEYPAGVRKERVDIIRQLATSELTNSGFDVLDPGIVTKTCSDAKCTERMALATQYGVKRFATVSVDSVARNNFLAGYYNSISGSLSLSDVHSNELLSVEHTESERGGLLFSSGQVFQGIISQVQNFGEDESFQKLAGKFSKTLVSKIPARPLSNASQNAEATTSEATIVQVETKPIKPAVLSLCVDGSPHATASLVLNRERSNLSEVSPGHYCGIYNLDDIARPSASVAVEVRSPYGSVARQDLPDLANPPCSVRNGVQLVNEVPSRATVLIAPQGFPYSKFVIYKGSSEVGPFRKVAETRRGEWIDAQSSSDTRYHVVCIDERGIWSSPEVAQSHTTKSKLS